MPRTTTLRLCSDARPDFRRVENAMIIAAPFVIEIGFASLTSSSQLIDALPQSAGLVAIILL